MTEAKETRSFSDGVFFSHIEGKAPHPLGTWGIEPAGEGSCAPSLCGFAA